MTRARKRPSRRRGAAVVEAAVVLPVILLFLFGVIEYGRCLMTLHLAQNAAREGCEYAAKHTSPITIEGVTEGNATSDVSDVVLSRLVGQCLRDQTVNVYLSDSKGTNLGTWTAANAGQYICVEVTGVYQFTLPRLLLLPSTMSLSVKSVKRSEGN